MNNINIMNSIKSASFFLVDNRIYYLVSGKYLEYIKMVDITYVPSHKDIIIFDDLKNYKNVTLITNFEVVLQYLMKG